MRHMHLSTRSAIRWRLRRRLWDVNVLRQLNIVSASALTKHFSQICVNNSPFYSVFPLQMSNVLIQIDFWFVLWPDVAVPCRSAHTHWLSVTESLSANVSLFLQPCKCAEH